MKKKIVAALLELTMMTGCGAAAGITADPGQALPECLVR